MSILQDTMSASKLKTNTHLVFDMGISRGGGGGWGVGAGGPDPLEHHTSGYRSLEILVPTPLRSNWIHLVQLLLELEGGPYAPL